MITAKEAREKSEQAKLETEKGGLNYCLELINEAIKEGVFECWLSDPSYGAIMKLKELGYVVELDNKYQIHTSYKVTW